MACYWRIYLPRKDCYAYHLLVHNNSSLLTFLQFQLTTDAPCFMLLTGFGWLNSHPRLRSSVTTVFLCIGDELKFLMTITVERMTILVTPEIKKMDLLESHCEQFTGPHRGTVYKLNRLDSFSSGSC